MSKGGKKGKARKGFPPPIPPDVAAQYFSQVAAAAKLKKDHVVASTAARSSFGSLDIAALAQAGDFSAAAVAAAAASKASSSKGPPCSQEEVKALMSMFAEIMGMASMEEPPKGSQANSPVFMFGSSSTSSSGGGWPPSAVAAAAAKAASMYMPDGWAGMDYDEDEDDDDDGMDGDSIPDLDDCDGKYPAFRKSEPREIHPQDWESLEQVAHAEMLEAEEKARKAAKKREKKQRKKERARKEAAEKAAQAAQKKQEKVVLSWRSRVVSACQMNDPTKLGGLLSESPLKKNEEDVNVHLDYMLPSCIARGRQEVEEGKEVRLKLVEFILKASPSVMFSIGRSGRNSIHAACFACDFYILKHVLDSIDESNSDEIPKGYLNLHCEDSGWAPIHYAVSAGSLESLECLLAKGCLIKVCTNESQTCRVSDGGGLTPRELAETILSGKHTDFIESDGSALREVTNQFLSSSSDRRQYHGALREVIDRLAEVEEKGYSPLGLPQLGADDDNTQARDRVTRHQEEHSRRKKKKKKKQQQQQADNNAAKQATPPKATAGVRDEDPMVAALLGMGFTSEQITAAAEACGGTNKATADDLVAWIFAQQEGGDYKTPEPSQPSAQEEPPMQPVQETAEQRRVAALEKAQREKAEAAKREEEARQAAERLAAKREEQRRRNREWNNREQARQREEAQAKAMQAAQAQQARIASNHAAMNPAVPMLNSSNGPNPFVDLQKQPTPLMQAQPILRNGQSMPKPGMNGVTKVCKKNGFVGGVPATHKAAAKAGPLAHPIKVLTRPKPKLVHDSLAELPNGMSKKAGAELQGLDSIFGSDNTTPTEVLTQTNSGAPEDATVSSLGSGQVTSADGTVEADQLGMDAPVLAGFHGLTPTAAPSAAPPGFAQPLGDLSHQGLNAAFSGNVNIANNMDSYVPATNPTGEIRATAKAFVPSGYRQPAPGPMTHNPPVNLPVDPLTMSMTSSPAGLGVPLVPSMASVETAPMGETYSLSRGMERTAPFLPNDRPHESRLHEGFNRTYSPVPSTASSLTGVITREEPRSAPGLGLNLEGSNPPLGGPSLLDRLRIEQDQPESSVIVPDASVWSGSATPFQPLTTLGALPSLGAFGGDLQSGNGDKGSAGSTWNPVGLAGNSEHVGLGSSIW